MQRILVLALVALISVACGGDADEPETSPPAGGTVFAVEAIEPVALAFIDSGLGSTVAVSVAPNEAGVEWIDIALDEDGSIRALVAATRDGVLNVAFAGEAYVVTLAERDLHVRGVIGDDEVTVLSGDGADVLAVEPFEDRSAARRDAIRGRQQPIRHAAGGAGVEAQGAGVSGQEEVEYIVDRPAHIGAEAVVGVRATIDGAPLDPIEATGYGPIIEGCVVSAAPTDSLAHHACAALGADQILVSALIRVPPPVAGEGATIFANRERCTEWVKLNSRKGNFLDWVGTTLAGAVAAGNPPAGFALGAVSSIVKGVFDAESGYSCATITVEDELIDGQLLLNEGFTVTVRASAFAREYDFTSDSVDVRPFASGEQIARPLQLSATLRGDAPSGGDDSRGDHDDVDGSYGVESLFDALQVAEDGGIVSGDEIRLLVSDGVVADFSGGYRLEDTATETGSQDRVLCRSDVTLDLVLADQVQLVDGEGEGPLEWLATQSLGRPTPLNNSGECDPDLAGEQQFMLTVRFRIADGVALVEFLSDGASLATLTLTR